MKRFFIITSALVLLAGATALVLQVYSESDRDLNLLLISIDTLRADALGLYGYPDSVSPNLDRLGRKSLVFKRAYATAPFTSPSHASILTSQYPSNHGIVFNGHRAKATLSRTSRTLGEHLQKYGFVTGGYVSGGPLSAKYGFNRGFDRFELIGERVDADDGGGGAQTVQAAVTWLEENRENRFFAWVHFMDPHLPYVCEGEVYDKLGMEWVEVRKPWSTYPDEDKLRSAYRAEVHEVDHHLGGLLDALERLDLARSTVIAVVADHGEYLYEHEFYAHFHLYDEVLNVPMFIHWPGLKKQIARNDTVSTIDLIPTVLPLLSMPPLFTARGRDLLDPENTGDQHPVFAEWRNHTILQAEEDELDPEDFLVSVQLGRVKLMRSVIKPDYQLLFDQETDPEELIDLSDSRPELRQRMEEVLNALIQDDLPDGLMGVSEIEIDEESREMLEALGYLQ